MPSKKKPLPDSELRFDPEGHKYFVGKTRVPSVSEILQKIGLTKNYDGVDPFYRDRGIACHKAIELHLKGILDPASLDPNIKPQFDAFLKFWQGHFKEMVIALEHPFAKGIEFAGTPDLITETGIWDWKCSKDHDKVAELQGQAYKHLSLQIHVPALPFIVVELHDDGTFKEFDYGVGFSQWDSVMDLYRWKTR
jgi:hypothetical protein